MSEHAKPNVVVVVSDLSSDSIGELEIGPKNRLSFPTKFAEAMARIYFSPVQEVELRDERAKVFERPS